SRRRGEWHLPGIEHPPIRLGDRQALIVFRVQQRHERIGLGGGDPTRVVAFLLRHLHPGRDRRILVTVPTRTMHTHHLASSRAPPAVTGPIADEHEPDSLDCGGLIQSGLVASTSGSVGSVAVALLDIASKSADAFPKISTAASDLASLAFTASPS